MPTNDRTTPVFPDPWDFLRQVTSARIALGRAGGSLPTNEWLKFKSDHAAARDAVHLPFEVDKLVGEIKRLGVDVVIANSAAHDRRTFLERPDLGRQLDEASQFNLQQLRAHEKADLVIVVSDGLSAVAVQRQVVPLLKELLPRLRSAAWRLAPIVVVRHGRVAVEDEIGRLLGAKLALMLIGERPGLGSPDSLGAYMVYGPAPANTDANRNCVSNIRAEGLPIVAAAETISYLLGEARRRQLSGVHLKDDRALLPKPMDLPVAVIDRAGAPGPTDEVRRE